MPRRQSFSQFLIGSADLDRPSFFYAYSGMWLHLLISVPVLIFFASVPILDALSSMAISSLSLGTIVYSILTREYGLLINLVSYDNRLHGLFVDGALLVRHLLALVLAPLALPLPPTQRIFSVANPHRARTLATIQNLITIFVSASPRDW